MTPALLLLLSLAPSVDDDAFSGRRLALVIGVNEFKDPHWTDLEFALNDARDIGAALEKSFDEVKIVGAERPATKQDVMNALASLSLRNVSDLDTIVIYLSTHGTLAHDERGTLRRVLVLSDTSAADPLGSGLSHQALVKQLGKLRSRHKVLILAACHSGAGKSVLVDDIRRELRGLKAPFFPEPEAVGEGQLVLSASAWGESAREDDGLQHDIYTHFLLEALSGFDRNGDGATTAMEVHDYARARTIAHTKGRQRPTLTAEIVGEAPIVLAGRLQRNTDPVVAAYASRFQGATLELNGRVKGPLPGSYTFEAGRHHVRVLKPGAKVPMLDTQIELHPGKVLVLDHYQAALASTRLSFTASWAFVRDKEVSQGYLPSHLLLALQAELSIAPRWWVGVAAGFAGRDAALKLGEGTSEVEGDHRIWLGRLMGTFSFTPIIFRGFALEAGTALGWTLGRRSASLSMASVNQLVAYPFGRLTLSATYFWDERFGIRLNAGAEVAAIRVEAKTRPVFLDDYGVAFVADL